MKMQLSGALTGLVAFCFTLYAPTVSAQELANGLSKAQTLKALRGAGVELVRPRIHPEVIAEARAEITRLRDAEGLRIVLPDGGARIGFEGERVGYLEVAPTLTDFRERLAGAATRPQVLSALEDLYMAGRQFVVRSEPYRDVRIALATMSSAERELLERYDAWSAHQKAWLGYWYLTIRFEAGRIARIEREWSPGPK